MIKGADLSHYQGNVNWNTLKAKGVQFVMIKATDGLSRVDPMFHENWVNAHKYGMLRGAYHFFRSNSDPYGQVNLFLKTVEDQLGEKPDLPHALDFEVITPGMDKNMQIDYALQWLVVTQKMSGIWPLLYTGKYFMEHLNDPPQFANFRLWLAEYTDGDVHLPKQWDKYTLWQYSDRGDINMDTDRFDGTYEELKALITTVS